VSVWNPVGRTHQARKAVLSIIAADLDLEKRLTFLKRKALERGFDRLLIWSFQFTNG